MSRRTICKWSNGPTNSISWKIPTKITKRIWLIKLRDKILKKTNFNFKSNWLITWWVGRWLEFKRCINVSSIYRFTLQKTRHLQEQSNSVYGSIIWILTPWQRQVGKLLKTLWRSEVSRGTKEHV